MADGGPLAMAPAPAPGNPPVQSLRIERRGGLAGLRAVADVGVAHLTDAQRTAVCQLLTAATLNDSGSTAALPTRDPHRPDRFRYRIRLALAGGRVHLLELPEEAMPEALASLVRPVLR